MDPEHNKNKFYVTTPIYYVSAKPHLGSLYTTVLADVYARWHKLHHEKVFFLTGTDEHGQKVESAANAAHEKPQDFVDRFAHEFKTLWQTYNLQYDSFIRTTDPQHIVAVQKWVETLQQKGDIYKSLYSGWYCTPCETFVEIAHEQKAPLCPSCKRETNFVSEESYFFKLSEYQNRLLTFYEQNPNFIMPKERFNEVISFVKSGLRDLSISRQSVTWGVPFPHDPNQTVYVWVDALINYLSGIGFGDKKSEKDFQFWWPADLQILGKDIIRFHAVYWPALLMAADLPLPKQLLVHGWIKVGVQKMSKSLGNAVDPVQLARTYDVDAIRYYLMRKIAVGHDTEYSTEDLEQHIAADLANDLGNLVNRTISLALRHNLGTIKPQTAWTESSAALRDLSWSAIENYEICVKEGNIHLALAHLWTFINQVNAYFQAQEPWVLANAKDAQIELSEVMSAVCHCLYSISIVLWPVMPTKMVLLLQSLGKELKFDVDFIEEIRNNRWDRGFKLSLIPPLFTKPEKTEVAEKKISDESAHEQNFITIDEAKKVQLRIGTILSCEDLPKSDKLYKLQVSFGSLGKRVILSGIKKSFKVDELIGKQALFLTNLQPRRMMGLESQGMLLIAKNENGQLSIMQPQFNVPDGTLLT